MPDLTADKTTFRRIQTDDPTGATVFFSIDLVSPMGGTFPGPMEPVTVTLTDAEGQVFAGLVDRARQQFCDQKNATVTEQP